MGREHGEATRSINNLQQGLNAYLKVFVYLK